MDGYGEPTYSAPEQHKALKQIKQSSILTPQGTQVPTSSLVTMVEELQIGDLIDDEEVQGRENAVFNGQVVAWKYLL